MSETQPSEKTSSPEKLVKSVDVVEIPRNVMVLAYHKYIQLWVPGIRLGDTFHDNAGNNRLVEEYTRWLDPKNL